MGALLRPFKGRACRTSAAWSGVCFSFPCQRHRQPPLWVCIGRQHPIWHESALHIAPVFTAQFSSFTCKISPGSRVITRRGSIRSVSLFFRTAFQRGSTTSHRGHEADRSMNDMDSVTRPCTDQTRANKGSVEQSWDHCRAGYCPL
jgi:hypothetical protein